MANSWSVPIGALVKQGTEQAERVIGLAIHQMFNNVVSMSPVGDPSNWKHPKSAPAGYVGGRFRANWNVSFESPDETTSTSVDRSRSDEAVQRSLTFKLGDVVWLTNGLPYAERLEYGWSGQAPGGMVRLSALAFRRYIAEAKAIK